MREQIFYRTTDIDGITIFYREAGLPGDPLLLLLHGFPSSSHMFRDLIGDLSPSFHIIAPDYPGFGQSSAPDTSRFTYSFDNIWGIIEHFIDRLQLSNFHLYMQDYGGPVGFRIASRRPQLIRSLIVQNANAYKEGLGDTLAPLISYIQYPDELNEKAARFFLTLDATKWQYLNGAEDSTKINPDCFIVDQYYLNRPGNDKIQLQLFRDYGSNLEQYDAWHRYFREYQPHTLILWGKNDVMFIEPGADAYKNDLTNAEIIKINGGHCLLEEHHHYVADLIKRFCIK